MASDEENVDEHVGAYSNMCLGRYLGGIPSAFVREFVHLLFDKSPWNRCSFDLALS